MSPLRSALRQAQNLAAAGDATGFLKAVEAVPWDDFDAFTRDADFLRGLLGALEPLPTFRADPRREWGLGLASLLAGMRRVPRITDLTSTTAASELDVLARACHLQRIPPAATDDLLGIMDAACCSNQAVVYAINLCSEAHRHADVAMLEQTPRRRSLIVLFALACANARAGKGPESSKEFNDYTLVAVDSAHGSLAALEFLKKVIAEHKSTSTTTGARAEAEVTQTRADVGKFAFARDVEPLIAQGTADGIRAAAGFGSKPNRKYGEKH
ncbi:hypothetical protein H9P43_007515 [Blastocladiella emersonii ATCC 22665]|nr:hypothetical protein H9P43_007515 [Blastocladiella emersonii ATCC 22665]